MKIILIYNNDMVYFCKRSTVSEECEMIVNLSELRIGEKAKVRGFNPGNPHYLRRLLAMGLVPDTEFVVIRAAPLGDPVEIKLNTFSLCVRKHEGVVLQLERVEHPSCVR